MAGCGGGIRRTLENKYTKSPKGLTAQICITACRNDWHGEGRRRSCPPSISRWRDGQCTRVGLCAQLEKHDAASAASEEASRDGHDAREDGAPCRSHPPRVLVWAPCPRPHPVCCYQPFPPLLIFLHLHSQPVRMRPLLSLQPGAGPRAAPGSGAQIRPRRGALSGGARHMTSLPTGSSQRGKQLL